MIAEVETLEDIDARNRPRAFEALVRNVIGQFQQIVSESPTLSDELRTIAANIEEPSRLVDFVASSLPFLTTDDKQQLLETASVPDRLELLNKHLAKEIEVQQLAHQDPDRGAGPGAAVAARLLSARADEGHPEGAGRAGRGPARNRRAAQEDRRRRHARGREERGDEGAFAPRRACLPWPPTTRSRATTSSGWRCCRGPKAPAPRSTSTRPGRFSTRITTS